MRSISEAEVITLLTCHARLDDFILAGAPDERVSVCTRGPHGGLAMLLIEDEQEHDAAVSFLRRRGTRYYDSVQHFVQATGASLEIRLEPID